MALAGPGDSGGADAAVPKEVCRNRRAFFDYEILERFEAGVELMGTEVKSIRAGKATIGEAYARVMGGSLWLLGCNISPHATTGLHDQHEPKRNVRGGRRVVYVSTMRDLHGEACFFALPP